MKKILIQTGKILAAAALMIALSGCFISKAIENMQAQIFEQTRFEDDTNYTDVPPEKSVDCTFYAPKQGIRHGYDSLYTDSQRTCYGLISDSAYRISETCGDDGLYPIGKVVVSDRDFTEKDMDLSIKAYTMDHPEVFWISNRYTYGSAGGQSIIQLYSYVSGQECAERINNLNEKVNSLMTSLPGGLKEYHLEKYLHNTLLDGCVYATGINTSDDGWEEFTSYGALVKGSAVCEGYAHAMCLLLNKVGIDCYYANGYGENAPHMWNTVKIYDKWYHLDATWDDNENAYFNYFNLSDEQVSTDHIIEPTFDKFKDEETIPAVYNLFLPECDSTDANYFVIESTYISDFEESKDIMVSDLIEAAQNGDTMFTVRFADYIAFSDAIEVMFNEEPYYMFDYIKEANDELDDSHQITDENLAIIMIENFNAVVVKLEY